MGGAPTSRSGLLNRGEQDARTAGESTGFCVNDSQPCSLTPRQSATERARRELVAADAASRAIACAPFHRCVFCSLKIHPHFRWTRPAGKSASRIIQSRPGGWRSNGHLTSHIPHLTSHISHLTSHIPHLTSHISHLTSHIPNLSPLTPPPPQHPSHPRSRHPGAERHAKRPRCSRLRGRHRRSRRR